MRCCPRWRCTAVVRCAAAVGLVAGLVVVVAVPSAAAAGWSITASPSPPGPPDGALSAVSCVSATQCVGVGSSATGTFAESWNGTTWSLVASPNPSGQRDAVLNGVSCTSATSCYAVGNTATATLIERWNGMSWSIVASANPPSPFDGSLSGVSCASATDCLAVGDVAAAFLSPTSSVKPLVEHWNGTDWSIVATPKLTGVSEAILSGVSCVTATACFAVGASDAGPLTERWNGSRWTIVSSPRLSGPFVRPAAISVGIDPGLTGVSCPSLTNCYAVGVSNTRALIEHWNGSIWSVVPTPNPKGVFFPNLGGVSCASPKRCTAVGSYSQNSPNGQGKELIEVWNGSSWSIVPAPNLPSASVAPTLSVDGFGGGGLSGVSCPAAASCAAVGDSALVDEWNGTRWSIAPLNATASQSVLAQVSCPSATDCYAVGFYTTGTTSFTTKTLVEHWNGTSWSIVASANPANLLDGELNGVSCPTATDCFAVGSYTAAPTFRIKPLIEHWNGSSWSIVSSPSPSGATVSMFDGVSCATAVDCSAVGLVSTSTVGKPLAEHWNGTSWAIVASPSPSGSNDASLAGVSCAAPTNCVAVGLAIASSTKHTTPQTLTERWNGTDWSIVPSPNPTGVTALPILTDVSCATTTDCTSVGLSTTFNTTTLAIRTLTLTEHWNGTTWSIVPSPNPSKTQSLLTGVSCTSTTDCNAVGDNQTAATTNTLIEHWDGSTWATVTTPNPPGASSAALSGVSCPTATSCYAVGSSDTNASVNTLAERSN